VTSAALPSWKPGYADARQPIHLPECIEPENLLTLRHQLRVERPITALKRIVPIYLNSTGMYYCH
jgi:hypothetical protein